MESEFVKVTETSVKKRSYVYNYSISSIIHVEAPTSRAKTMNIDRCYIILNWWKIK